MSTVKLAFTSCMDAEDEPRQPVWDTIRAQEPDALFLLGDQIYMDWKLKPKWKRIFTGQADGPALFAQDMHRRYALQWGVESFRKLIAWVVEKKGADRVLVAWDEHDMAWNNACGEALDDGSSDPDSDAKHGVPKLARDMAKLLFGQFMDHLQKHPTVLKYPDLPADVLTPPPAREGVQRELTIDGIETLLLDERFYRTDREHPRARMLGAAQLRRLTEKVSNGTGLIVVAGSSPLKHRYFLSNQGWDGKRKVFGKEPPYPDLQAFERAARRPVLYVGGDIHRTRYTGLLPDTNIVQVLASGAARGSDWKAERGSFAVAHIDKATRTCTVRRHSARGLIGEQAPRYLDRGWDSTGPGLAEEPEGLPIDDKPLFVAVMRRHGAVPASCSPRELDALFEDRLPRDEAAEALTLKSQGQKVDLSLRPGAAALEALFSKAAAQAKARQCKSLVLFVHAFDKSMAESVEQGLHLRYRYPSCEPVLFSWPSGDRGGLGNFATALTHIDECAAALGAMLPAFVQAARDAGLKSVLLARSLGARMLSHLQPATAQGLDRLVLSAPAISEADHAATMNALPCPVFVTLNRDDSTLKRAPLPGDLLGNHRPVTLGQRSFYIDCTDVDDADTHHDYFLDGGDSPHLQALHERLLYDEPISANALPPGFTASPQQPHLLTGLPE